MSKEKRNKKPSHGGFRLGAGHPKTGVTKAKICVSVDEVNWEAALKRWKGKGSRLIDGLIEKFVLNEVSI